MRFARPSAMMQLRIHFNGKPLMSPSRAGLFAICTLLLIASVEIDARCRSLGLSLTAAEEAFANAELVFVGTLKSRSKKKSPDSHSRHVQARPTAARTCQDSDDEDASELTRVTVTSGSRASPWVGEFALERYYKGEPTPRIQVRIDEGLEVGERYLVYAYRHNDELDASMFCSGSAFAHTAELQEHLSYLDTLPAAGTGGFVDLRLSSPNGRSNLAQVLDFVGPKGNIRLRYDDVRGANDFLSRSVALPAGQYRLLTAAEPGFRFRCGTTDSSCDELEVQDRAVAYWGINIEPLSLVRVDLRDAHGESTEVDAEFEFLDAANGKLVDFQRADRWSKEGQGIAGRLTPSRVVPVLILTPVNHLGKLDSTLGRQRIYSEGKSSWRLAQAFEIRPGDNLIEFRLPVERQPVTTRINLDVVDSPWQFAMGSAGLKVWAENGSYIGTRDHSLSCSHRGTGSCSVEFLGIPGQFWSLRMSGHHFFDDDDQTAKRDEQLIEVIAPSVLELNINGKAISDALRDL